MRIAVVEDNAAICTMLSNMLQLAGHVPAIYYEGWPFLDELTRNYHIDDSKQPNLFDGVLLDVVLPGSISGTEIINYLYVTRPDLPLIVMSALNSSDLANIQRQFPEVTMLQKPFHLQELRVAIEGCRTIGVMSGGNVARMRA